VSSIVKAIREINDIMSIKEKEDRANHIQKETIERRMSQSDSYKNTDKYLDNETKVRIPLSD